jgi:hypothetical protein
LINGLDGAHRNDPLVAQLAGAAVGAGRSCALKGVFGYMGAKAYPTATRGVAIGMSARALDSATHRSTYVDQDGHFDVFAGLAKAAVDVINPTAIATDFVLWGTTDYLEGLLNLKSAGGFRRNPFNQIVRSAAIFGGTDSAG